MFNLLYKLLNILKTLKSLNGLIHIGKMAEFFWLGSLFGLLQPFKCFGAGCEK